MLTIKIHAPVCGAVEHDALQLYANNSMEAAPLGTSVVDASIQFFATSFPLQTPKIQEGVLEQITSMLSSMTSHNNPAREIAAIINVSTSLLFALQSTSRDALSASSMKAVEVEKGTEELLHVCSLAFSLFSAYAHCLPGISQSS